jgi:hypothetical protein
MDLARQALISARVSQAERYAPEELTAGQEALDKSSAAVAARDFKLALNYALDSRYRAQAAARLAEDRRQTLLTRIEDTLTNAAALVASGRTAVTAAGAVRATRRTAAKASAALEMIEKDLRKAREQVEADDLGAADRLVQEAEQRIAEALAGLSP